MKQVTYTQRACSVQHSAVPAAGCRLVPSALTRKGSADGAAETHHASHGKSLCEETALAFWGLPCVCKEPGEAKGWLMGFCFLLPWAIKGSQEKAAATLRYAPVPKRDATRAVSTRPAAIHRHPQQGHEPLHQDTDSQANKLLFFFYAHTHNASHYLLMPEALQISLLCEWHRWQSEDRFLTLNFFCLLNA